MVDVWTVVDVVVDVGDVVVDLGREGCKFQGLDLAYTQV